MQAKWFMIRSRRQVKSRNLPSLRLIHKRSVIDFVQQIDILLLLVTSSSSLEVTFGIFFCLFSPPQHLLVFSFSLKKISFFGILNYILGTMPRFIDILSRISFLHPQHTRKMTLKNMSCMQPHPLLVNIISI